MSYYGFTQNVKVDKTILLNLLKDSHQLLLKDSIILSQDKTIQYLSNLDSLQNIHINKLVYINNIYNEQLISKTEENKILFSQMYQLQGFIDTKNKQIQKLQPIVNRKNNMLKLTITIIVIESIILFLK